MSNSSKIQNTHRNSCILSFNNHGFWKNNEYSMEKGWITCCNRTVNTHTHTHGESGSQSGRRELSQNLSGRQNCPNELGHNDQQLYTYTHTHYETETFPCIWKYNFMFYWLYNMCSLQNNNPLVHNYYNLWAFLSHYHMHKKHTQPFQLWPV